MKRHNGEYPAPLIPLKGWMSGMELEWLYQKAKEHQTIFEIGSAFGRSSHALLSGNWESFMYEGKVYCVDIWPGHIKETKEDFNYGVKDLERRWEFARNVMHFPNLQIWEMSSVWASRVATMFEIEPDMVFLDGGTKQMRTDILHWSQVSRHMLFCGHDYDDEYPAARSAVDDLVDGFELVEGTSIWYLEK